MSAFVVSPFHINVLVTWAVSGNRHSRPTYYWNGRSHEIQGNEKYVADTLYRENLRSVNHRYKSRDEDASSFVFHPEPLMAASASAVQIIKACHCLIYQSCETEDWEQTEAYAIVQVIKARAERALPGYEEAAWDLGELLRVPA